ncbi:MAG TPA: PucR family transcriptional regulator ligand-binding domain-containing protein, partial [Solirubrobacterales bacterium]|nr:PucR family transcriptional regulator ligand-binding domain-containing protein [Solirubrobacterales bacterium]
MLTVSSLLKDCGLELAAGDSAAGREVRWVAITEHEDPTPWLSGGEVVLTTGYNLDTQKKQRAYVARLAEHGVSALGFGIGFDHSKLPAALREAASA